MPTRSECAPLGFVVLWEAEHSCTKRMKCRARYRFGHDVRQLMRGGHPFEGDGPTRNTPSQYGVLGRQEPRGPTKPFEMRPVCHRLGIGVYGSSRDGCHSHAQFLLQSAYSNGILECSGGGVEFRRPGAVIAIGGQEATSTPVRRPAGYVT